MNYPRWSHDTRIIVILLSLVGLGLLVFFALPLFETLFITALIAYLLNPVVRFFMRRFHMRRALAALLVYVLTLLILASLPAAAGTVAYSLFQRWGSNLAEALEAIRKWLSQPILILGYDLSPRLLIANLGEALGSAITALPRGPLDFLSQVTANVLWGLVILIGLYYFLKDGPKLKPWLVSLAPEAYQGEVNRLLEDLDRVWSIFLRVQLLIFVVIAVLFLIGSMIVIWLYRLGWLPFSTIGLIVMLVIVYTLAQQVDNLWLRPQLMGHQLRLHPAVVFVGLIGALALSGVIGAIVVVPLIASARLIAHYIRCKLLDLPPWQEPSQPAGLSAQPVDQEGDQSQAEAVERED